MPKKPQQPLAKLSRPRLYKAVARERLFELLDEKREHPVVWIVGPPGAGKTTLAASYLEEAGLPAIWYQIDPGDSDPATFFFYLKQAIEAVAKRKARPLPLLTPEYLPDLPGFARRFLRDAFAQLPEDVILVFDNYHDIAGDSALHAAFKAALAEVPPGSNVIVLSRADPPPAFADALVNQTISLVSWEELRLTPEETTAIALSRGVTDSNLLRTLHEQSAGWIAGVTLMLERLRHGGSLEALQRAEALDTVFDYFAGLIFDNASEEMCDVLMKTAFLPRVSAALAEAVTGKTGAIRLLEELHRRHLFTDRSVGNEITYQYHALFRAFLTNRARTALPLEERRRVLLRGAQCLEAQGQVEEAFNLYLEAENWAAAEKLLVAAAAQLIAHGRWRTLDAWGRALPKKRLSENPWLRYWLGRSQTLVDPGAARPWLETAYAVFHDRGDETGQLLCAVSVLEALFYEFKDLRAMDPWAEKVTTFLGRGVGIPSREDELRANAAIMMWAAHRLPQHPLVSTCVRRVEELLSEPFDVNLLLEVATLLLDYSSMAMDVEAERIAIREARALLDSPHLSALRIFYFHGVEGYSHYIHGRYQEGLACFDKADSVASEHGLEDAKFRGGIWRGICQRRAGLLTEAEATLRELEKFPRPAGGVRFVFFSLLQAGIDFDRGNFDSAISTILEAHQASEECGHFSSIVLLGVVAANMAIAGGRFEAARKVLTRVKMEAHGPAENFLGAAAMNDAWLAHRVGDKARRDSLLRESLRRARDTRARERLRWYPNALSQLLPLAIDQGIEPEMALSLAREFHIVPSPLQIESWPWPIKVYTLGRFEILLDDQPPEYSRKQPKTVLALLKAIIAYGGHEVPEQKLIDALWPDDDGDAGRRSLTATLHRLRKLLANGNAIRQAGGSLTLDDRCCWVDAAAFESRLGQGGDAGEASETAFVLYRGAFLAQEEDAPWAMPMRERLRAKFIHAVAKLGVSLEESGRYESAIDIYVRGIEADNLVEPFYQGLMRCYDRLNRRTEAATAYRRLRQTLSVTLGIQPSSESQRLFETLRLN